MESNRPQLYVVLCTCAALFLSACQDNSQSPPARPEPPREADAPGGSMLAPIDLVYVCGKKFLVTNSTKSQVHVEYRVVGTRETGSLTLREGPGQDPGYSETELETIGVGVVELYRDDQRVARRRNGGTFCGPSAMSAFVAAVGTDQTGSWSAPFPWPVVGLHVSLLPNGTVLSWGHGGEPQLWDPATGTFTEVVSPSELFCAGHAFLGDGRLLVSGGHISDDHGLPDINLFIPSSQSWSRSTPMRRGRWYPTNTTLASGDVVILAGRDEAGVVVAEPEVWSSGTVRVLSTASLVLPYYPRTFLAPNGNVFYAGELQSTGYLDPSGTGRWTTLGNRLYGLRDYGSAVMYDEGKILYVGGGRTTNTAEIIDLNAAVPTWQWTGSMAFPRRHLNATVLPTGEVLVTGGTSGTGFNDVAQAVHAAELWNPTTGFWTTLASNTVNRAYHSTSILLPDGRILHAGSGDGGSAPNERNAELFSPPYLFRGPRPTITAAPALVAYGASFSASTPDADLIAKVSLIRLGSVTHAFDMNQRFQWLSFTHAAGALTISAPTSRNRTPPGDYMLFILDGNGVPSVAKIIRMGSTSDPGPPVNAPPTANFTSSCTQMSCAFTDGSTDADGTVTGWSWTFGDGGTSTARSPTRSYATPGTYTVTLTATDNLGATNQRSHQVTVTAPPSSIVLSATGRADATIQYMSLKWSGAKGTMVDIYRNGGFLRTTANDGSDTNGRTYHGAATYVFKVCEAGTGTCSNEATVQFGDVPPPPPPPGNVPPTANFTSSCTDLACTFTDGSTDADGTVTGWSWTFGDGGTSTAQSPTRTYATAGTYTVTLTATDNLGATNQRSHQVTVGTPPPPPANLPPTANFTSSCTNLSCAFTDGSTDADGTVTGWSWTFGDGGTSTARSPTRSYATPGTYTVTLTATDNLGATNQRSHQVTVTAPPSSIVLSATGRADATIQYMSLKWSGAKGTMVDIYRNGGFLRTTANDGSDSNGRTYHGAATYVFKVCEAGTTVCSNQATVVFN